MQPWALRKYVCLKQIEKDENQGTVLLEDERIGCNFSIEWVLLSMEWLAWIVHEVDHVGNDQSQVSGPKAQMLWSALVAPPTSALAVVKPAPSSRG